MRKVLLFSLLLLCTCTLAFAQPPGSIGLFSDSYGLSCDLIDAPGLISIYVVHVYTPGATGSQFRVDCASGGAVLTYLADQSPFLIIGNSQTGIAVAYGGCYASPINMLTVLYLGNGTSPSCSYCRVVPDPIAVPLEILVSDCQDPPNLLISTGGTLIINPNPSCYCDIPVEETSWGQIKSLYK